ncbi:DNA-binding response regulator, OmpR family, contains REC and winged-helix (wHTH) domain [Caloramator quimbayensis]|uniref:Stage 0 sporulation protein A homolog n=1 Tax=Caloramator quimbayensis TaxID=1147123 RepID=A0A1T4Y245_9CLOT|nr:response regulator transcription factor [Caloramator quimbayensis]SKA95401.1 DNA-binding response regulator, OmpR family, contains REC and winged-helix (wHTH) domain [Caloramator quimbayensis]
MVETKVLVVDDDSNICDLIELYLQKEGYRVYKAHNGSEAIKIYRDKTVDIIVLDIMMPIMDGYETLKEIRKTSSVPVLMLTAKGETFDRVLGLELGADDYIVKPFEPKELVARIKAVLRRYKPQTQKRALEFSDLIIDADSYIVKYKGQEMEMPPKEFELLYFIASNPNKVFTRDQLLYEVWGYDYPGDSRTVDVHVKRLREKLPDNKEWQIKTVWGVGYKFEVK